MEAKQICFTLNNPVDSPEALKDKLEQYCEYAVFQREKGENGTEHYQGYMELSKKRRYAWCQKHIAKGHYEARKGPREAARAYCQKEETRIAGPYEIGVWKEKKQGARTDLTNLLKRAMEGATYTSIVKEEPHLALRYHRGIKEILKAHDTPRTGTLTVNLIHGPTRIGKSYYLHNKYGTAAYWKRPGKWWDGYEGQKVIVLDEYTGWIPLYDLLNLLDPYPLQLETKGGHVNIKAEEIWITTNTHPRKWHYDWLDKQKESYTPLLARITNCWTIKNRLLTPKPQGWLENWWEGIENTPGHEDW